MRRTPDALRLFLFSALLLAGLPAPAVKPPLVECAPSGASFGGVAVIDNATGDSVVQGPTPF